MKKRILVVLTVCMIVQALAGCGKAIPEMTEEQQKMVTQYAADLLLKYDKNHKKKDMILTPEQIAELEAELVEPEIPIIDEPVLPDDPDETPTIDIPDDPGFIDAGDVEGSQGAPVNRGIAQLLGFTDFSFDYTGYEITKSHFVDSYVSMDASPGTSLVVFYFDVTNNGVEAEELNIRDIQTRFRIFINHGKQNNVLKTWLADDLSNFRGTFEPGETKTLVLVIEVNEDTISQNFDTIQLILKLEDDSTTIDLE